MPTPRTRIDIGFPDHRGSTLETRRAHVRIADTENCLEGIIRDPSSNPIFDAYICGEIAVCDMVPLYKAQLAREGRHGPP